MNIEDCISRDPNKLFDWITDMNDAYRRFWDGIIILDTSQYAQQGREAKVLCLLFAEKKLSFHDFMWHILKLGLFERARLGIVFTDFEFSDEPVPFPTEAYNQITSTEGWADVFQ